MDPQSVYPDLDQIPLTPPPIKIYPLEVLAPIIWDDSPKRKTPETESEDPPKKKVAVDNLETTKDPDVWFSAAFLHRRKRIDNFLGFSASPNIVTFEKGRLIFKMYDSFCMCGHTHTICVTPSTDNIQLYCDVCDRSDKLDIPDLVELKLCEQDPHCLESSHESTLEMIIEDGLRPIRSGTFNPRDKSRPCSITRLYSTLLSGIWGLANLMLDMYADVLRYDRLEDQFEIFTDDTWVILTNGKMTRLVQQELSDQIRWLFNKLEDSKVRVEESTQLRLKILDIKIKKSRIAYGKLSIASNIDKIIKLMKATMTNK